MTRHNGPSGRVFGTPEDSMTWLPDDAASLGDAAIAYASQGFRVVPVWGIHPSGRCGCGRHACEKPGKHPIGNAWQKTATSDVDAVYDARRRHPHANIGLALGGRERYVAIDIDGPAGRASWTALQSGGRAAPRTLTSRSGRVDGGEHRIYRVPPHLDSTRLRNSSSVNGLAGIDTRTEGGQIVVAPSRHASGARYAWTDRHPIADLPEWLFEAIARPREEPAALRRGASREHRTFGDVDQRRRYVDKAVENAARDIAASQSGQRNSMLFAKACTVFEYHVGQELDHRDAWRTLAGAAHAAGLPDHETDGVLTRAWRRAQAAPRQVPSPYSRGTSNPTARDTDWERALDRNNEGSLRKTLGNVITILALDPRWSGVIAFDAFGDCAVTTRPPPTRPQDTPLRPEAGDWTEENSVTTVAWLSSEHGLDVTTTIVDQAVVAVSRRKIVHPVRDYLEGLTWDRVPRLDAMLAKYFGAADTPYTRGVSSRWMISAVARVFEPGCQADCTLVLESRKHGTGKSTGLEILAGKEWYACTGLHIGDKDSYQCLRRKWIYELGELTGLRGRELNRTKNFLSERVSNFRSSYGRRNRDVSRQVVFAGTTNESEYLEDKTGNRRFWPVRVLRDVDRAALRSDRDQLWAEAHARYRNGEEWHVNTPEFKALCEAEQAERVHDDPWEIVVQDWLTAPWLTRPDDDGRWRSERLDVRRGITTTDVLLGAIKKKPADISKADQMRAAEVLRTLGWDRSTNKIPGPGGLVRRWFRIAEVDLGLVGGWSKGAPPNAGNGERDQPSNLDSTFEPSGTP